MEKEWKKLIDEVENNRSYSSEPHFKFIDFIREKSTIEDKRAIVQEVERRIKTFERCDPLFQFRLVQQVGIAGEQRHVFREIHARFFVHCPLVDGTRTHRTAFELAYESLLAVQEVELVAVQ